MMKLGLVQGGSDIATTAMLMMVVLVDDDNMMTTRKSTTGFDIHFSFGSDLADCEVPDNKILFRLSERSLCWNYAQRLGE
mmetsp:Transcript_31053/g.60647  ORF Transcript_31053/g.60647 Transcript_31053/m.60647 type:complete len:80 (+) Transcript_31053:1977-2216(+)